jgi:murein DD-endopeptidase MepM/ murein hydrolase activator NlpD
MALISNQQTTGDAHSGGAHRALATHRHAILAACFAAAITYFLPPDARSASRPLGLVLPTDNTALFSREPWKFYMYTNRSFEGVSSTPWEGGQYGFSRNLKRTAAGLINTKFHEGVDIRPVRRTSDGTPLDTVRSIAAGSVVHTSNTSGQSSYGRYVVVKHDWGYGPFYSLYAHLMSISVKRGQNVGPGTVLGRLGYTGVGINRTRSHVHLELNMLLSSRFEQWHDLHHRSPNYHGIYNGLNMAGIDIAGLFLAHRGNSNISIPDFTKRMDAYFKVLVPNRGTLEITKRYPWLGNPRRSSSWEISLSRSGIPLAVKSSSKRVSQPTVSWVKHSPTYHSYLTRGLLSGSGSSASLSNSGTAYIRLISGGF